MKPKKKATKRVAGKASASAAERKQEAVPAKKAKASRGVASAEATPPEATAKPKRVRAAVKAARKRVARKAAGLEPAPPSEATAATGAPVIPPILLEGDRPSVPVPSGPGQRYALGPQPPAEAAGPEEAELPEAYGTKQIFLTACDPHWLYVYWDFTRAQLRYYNQRAREGHLTLRIHLGTMGTAPHIEIPVHPESRHWFARVERGGARYIAELGYYRKQDRAWMSLGCSQPTLTPPEVFEATGPVQFMSVPPEVPLSQLQRVVETLAAREPAVAAALAEARREGQPELPVALGAPAPAWSAQQEEAIRPWVRLDALRRVWVGSLEVTELVRRALESWPTSPGPGAFGPEQQPRAVSSPLGGPGGAVAPGGFWFNIHAELIIYGATEPDAKVTLHGQPVTLRPDGSFSCRFVLPDGHFELEAVAVNAEGSESRRAVLRFHRHTTYQGSVTQAPADPNLAPPPRAGS